MVHTLEIFFDQDLKSPVSAFDTDLVAFDPAAGYANRDMNQDPVVFEHRLNQRPWSGFNREAERLTGHESHRVFHPAGFGQLSHFRPVEPKPQSVFLQS